MKYHCAIIYDGIENSVFAGQVLAPLVENLQHYPQDRGLIISFEKYPPSPQSCAAIRNHGNIEYCILRKMPFIGSLSLHYAAYQLRQVIKKYDIATLVVRGPLAAWIVAKTPSLRSVPCIVQARGLAAQEYAYAHRNSHGFMKKFHQFRTYHYEVIERYVYGTYAQQNSVMIRAVSEPLREYLITTFGTPPEKISVEQEDIPIAIDSRLIQSWRTTTRAHLGIDNSSYIYVYNGSAKPWQCPEETIAYFMQEYRLNSHAFLLILTQDEASFKKLCTSAALPTCAYRIMQVAHGAIYQHLAAADAGIIFRQHHIINWVSRPTKILEYQAVGLPIIHNNTVAMLAGK